LVPEPERGVPAGGGEEGGQVADSEAPELAGVDFGAADRLARAFADRDGQPGLAYGIVAGGRLVHSGGLGERWLERCSGLPP
jgi:hypothetical protein